MEKSSLSALVMRRFHDCMRRLVLSVIRHYGLYVSHDKHRSLRCRGSLDAKSMSPNFRGKDMEILKQLYRINVVLISL